MTSPFLTASESAIFEDLRQAALEVITLSQGSSVAQSALNRIESAKVKLVDYIVESRAKAAGV